MILLGYIILGHREWKHGHIKIFAIYPEETCDEERSRLFALIQTGQLPIAPKNIEIIPKKSEIDPRSIIAEKSKDADLTIIGIREEVLRHDGAAALKGYETIGNTVFVNVSSQILIK
jgi:hypothetical protein